VKTVLIIIAFLMSGCGVINRFSAEFKEYTYMCVDGVSYLQFPSGASVQLDNTGKPVVCK
jgi:hypothetical protein